MTREARRQFRVTSLDLESLNFTFGLLADRLDELEGRRGTPQFKADVNMGLNKVTQMKSGSASTDGATVVQVDTVESDLSGATAGVANLTASATPGANRIVMSPSGSQYINDGWITPAVQNVVTGSRVLGTAYQNTTGRLMWVAVSGWSDALSYLSAYTDGSNPPTTEVRRVQPQTIAYASLLFAVLPGNYYKAAFSAGVQTLTIWTEWY